jgi:hypothetical protein
VRLSNGSAHAGERAGGEPRSAMIVEVGVFGTKPASSSIAPSTNPKA